jgi:hypothetical protein
MDRRSFFTRCAVTGAAASLLPGLVADAPAAAVTTTAAATAPGSLAPAQAMSSRPAVDRSWFRGFEGRAFLVHVPGGGTHRLELTEVEEGRPSSRVDHFRAVFRVVGPAPALDEGQYVVTHPSRGEMALLLDHKTRDTQAGLYTATFALLR